MRIQAAACALALLAGGCLKDLTRRDKRTETWRGRTELELERLAGADETSSACRQLFYIYSRLNRREKRDFKKRVGPQLLTTVRSASTAPAALIDLLDRLSPSGTRTALKQVLGHASEKGDAEGYVASALALLRRGGPKHLAVRALIVATVTGHKHGQCDTLARRMGCEHLGPLLKKIITGGDRGTDELLVRMGLDRRKARAFALRAAASTASRFFCVGLGPALLDALSTHRNCLECVQPLARSVGLLDPPNGREALIQLLSSDSTARIRAAASGLSWTPRPHGSISDSLVKHLQQIAVKQSDPRHNALFASLIRAIGRVCGAEAVSALQRIQKQLEDNRKNMVQSALRRINIAVQCGSKVECFARIMTAGDPYMAERAAVELGRTGLRGRDRSAAIEALRAVLQRKSTHPAVRRAVRASLKWLKSF
jgi:hypothetical protein